MQIKIVKGYPQNYQSIKQKLNPPEDALFPFGDTVYNPSGLDIALDIQEHERVHIKQQAKWISPEFWWTKYMLVKGFRQEQELEAFSAQCLWVKYNINTKAYEECLDECAEKLSANYHLGLTKSQCKTLIRKWK